MRRLLLVAGCTIALTAATSSAAGAQGQPVENNVLNLGQCIAGDAVDPSEASSTAPVIVLFAPPFADPGFGFDVSPTARALNYQGQGCSTLFFTP